MPVLITPALLITANLLPLIGVLWWQWDVASVVVFFWAENLVIGFYNIIKMLSYGTGKGLFLSLFFAAHYGGFTAGHGFFISELFDLKAAVNYGDAVLPGVGLFELLREVLHQFAAVAPPLWLWGFAALVVSHGGSLLVNFFLRGERQQTSPDDLMSAPYKRLAILHVTIIIGGMGIETLGSPLPLLVLLVLLKIAIDLRAHLLEHQLNWRFARYA